MITRRDYAQIAAGLPAGLVVAGGRETAMRAVADALWAGLSAIGVSWVGFYVDQPGEAEDRRLVLGPHRDKPACSPIGLHGVCGQALVSRSVRIIDDVAALGADYIACDPRDRSEIVVPLLEEENETAGCWGVLDLDSFERGAFDEDDARGLHAVLAAAGLRASKS